jgi:signal recognition particle subunit SRP54
MNFVRCSVAFVFFSRATSRDSGITVFSMFENLTEKLQRTFKNLRGQGKLTEEHLDAALAEIREALLEGDVNVGVADELLANIRKKAIGSDVMLQLSPDQQVVKVVRDELTFLLGKHAKPLFASRPPSVWMIVGLQGSGKTTTTGKLAKWLTEHGHRPLVVSTDVYRPAAREQLAQVAKAINIAVWPGKGTDKPSEIVKGAIKEAKLSASDVIIVDTAGRLHIDDELMNELGTLKKELQPSEILFIADAMIGQDAVRSAGEFHKRLGLTGVILTKLDGDARGGAALSIGKVTGAPVKFVGLGEKYDALEGFYPERIVSRVLGMGDIMSLIERAEQSIDKKAAADLERRLRKEEFTLEDFRDQLKQIRKMGPLEQLVDMLPKMGPLANLPKDTKVDEGKLKQVEAIINSMTNQERRDHSVIDGKRRRRIAAGSGTSVQEVNQVLKQYLQMRTMMKQYGALAGRGKLRGLGKLAGLS